MTSAEKIDYSIIICTYNPERDIFKRSLWAISKLCSIALVLEVIIIDNNSSNPISALDFVQDFLQNVPRSKLLLVKQQGLSYARIAGVEAANSEHIIFFDDDNEPDADYVKIMDSLNKDFPHVAAWGPGNVKVDFMAPVKKELEAYAIDAFQGRQELAVTYSNQLDWQPCYPYGTGLCIKKKYLTEYISMVRRKKFTLIGRTGGEMNSGEDTQMILFCISKGAAAGVSPQLKMTHMVAAKRSEFEYLKRLTYGTSRCYSICAAEVFPGYLIALEKKHLSELRFVKKTLTRYFLLYFKKKPKHTFDLISFIGSVSSDYSVLNKSIPSPVTWVLKRLKLS